MIQMDLIYLTVRVEEVSDGLGEHMLELCICWNGP